MRVRTWRTLVSHPKEECMEHNAYAVLVRLLLVIGISMLAIAASGQQTPTQQPTPAAADPSGTYLTTNTAADTTSIRFDSAVVEWHVEDHSLHVTSCATCTTTPVSTPAICTALRKPCPKTEKVALAATQDFAVGTEWRVHAEKATLTQETDAWVLLIEGPRSGAVEISGANAQIDLKANRHVIPWHAKSWSVTVPATNDGEPIAFNVPTAKVLDTSTQPIPPPMTNHTSPIAQMEDACWVEVPCGKP
jgi:hypothetical protein